MQGLSTEMVSSSLCYH